jgi:glycosyltransferase involved in cell wall biosynthesis
VSGREPMRLLLTADAVGGVWQYALDLAQALVPHGIVTTIAQMGPAASEHQRAAAEQAGVTLIETGLPLDWLVDAPGPVLAAGARTAELARETGADLVQVNMPSLAAAAPPGVPVIAAAHGCVTSWWAAAYPGEQLPASFDWHRRLTGEGLRAADLVVAPTSAYARIVARHYGLPRVPAVVHNGRRALVATPAARTSAGVFTAGRLWDRVKRTPLLDAVAALLPVPSRAAGAVNAPHGEVVTPAHLHLLGVLDDASLAAELAARPIFVSAAVFEPFGLAVLEAAAAGCPLVLADQPGFRELWEGAAVFVPDDDASAYARAIGTLLDDAALRDRLGDAARVQAARYSAAAMADGMVALYRRVLGERQVAERAA